MAKKIKVLVVGDWIIDENWFLVKHHSEISSHVGFQHYRLANKHGEGVRDICGAGHVIRVLNQFFSEKNTEEIELVGLGRWNKADMDLINHLMHRKENREKCDATKVTKSLYPICCDQKSRVKTYSVDESYQTIKVVRQFYKKNGGIEQINRVDFDWGPFEEQEMDEEFYVKKLRDFDILDKKDITDIIIYDLKKGVVTKRLIKVLADHFHNASWYVRSKDKSPEWIDNIKEENLKLFFIGPEVAAIHNPWESWLVNGRITDEAAKVIKNNKGTYVFLLTEENEFIAKFRETMECLTGQFRYKNKKFEAGWANIYFAKLLYLLIENGKITMDNLRNELVKSNYDLHSELPEAFIERRDRIKPYAQDIQLNLIGKNWQGEIDNWKNTKNPDSIGVLYKPEPVFEIWRGFPILHNYISCITQKQKILCEIGRYLRVFRKSGTNIHSLSLMLKADPGSGKTLLAKSLSDAFRFSFLHYDISKMIHRSEILEIFDSISTRQAHSNDPVFIFVDEINTYLEGNFVFSPFLGPIEDGVYYRHGKNFKIKACVWMFAGTNTRSQDQDSRSNEQSQATFVKGEKISDFESRMTLIREIDLTSLIGSFGRSSTEGRKILHQAKLEQVYLGATMIRKFFPDVSIVDYNVLEYFYNKDPFKRPFREIRRECSALKNVQFGRVSKKNFRQIDPDRWSEREEDVRLIS
ncbi:MAG: AAA family ATPase [Deltaproteobacteria bacterium]|nr:AAA family ATPase [Deltaproteobacteria bacterium]